MRRHHGLMLAGGFLVPLLVLSAGGLAHASSAQSPNRVAGIVVDVSGAPVPGATIEIAVAGSAPRQLETGEDGRFEAGGLQSADAVVRASAPGFTEASVSIRTGEGAPALRLILRPASLVETVTVTASRGAEPLSTPASATVLTSAELLTSAAGALDDTLRNTPGFSLFRRSSSRVSNPTTQGVTLRGLSGSGASRTVVLADGLPLNDAFGSWVYWNKVPLAAIDRVEVVRGATGDLYGADALGGVIQVLTFASGRTRLRAMGDLASHETPRVSAFGGTQAHGWSGLLSAEWLTTDGVVTTARESRGPVDVAADSDYATGFGTAGYTRGSLRTLARVNLYRETRSNGTPAQVNETRWRQVSGEAGGSVAGGAWLARGAGGTQTYSQTFTAVAADRRSERLTTAQRIPSAFATAAGQWTRAWRSQALLVGGEWRRARSTIDETRYSPAGTPSEPFVGGGTEVNGSVFGRIMMTPSDRLTVIGGVRGDFWHSAPHGVAGSEHSSRFFSPRASLSYRLTSRIGLQASVYRAYRTPTLNELHRGFRVGNVVTNPNAALDPERLTGLEGGVLFTRTRVSARVTGFWNQLEDAITNVTLSETPALITRERQNTDTVRASGTELEADYRPVEGLTISGFAALTASHFHKTPAQPVLQGNRVPQVPVYQVGCGLTYVSHRGLTASTQLRIVGAQFDDDLNQFALRAYAVVDGSASKELRRGVQAFLAVENLFDTDYDVGRTPIRTVGWPRTVRGGFRLALP